MSEKDLSALDAQAIQRQTQCPVVIFDSVTSTNTVAKEYAAKGCPNGTAVLARNQSAGRGRRGRSFFSDADGIYLSVILRPNEAFSNISLITPAAAVAVCDAIYETAAVDCRIKWVNDLFLRGKKICGILTEAVTDAKSGVIDSVVVGIGINFCGDESALPAEIRSVAGFLFEKNPTISKNALAAAIVNCLTNRLAAADFAAFVPDYRRRCFILGKEIEFVQGGKTVHATAVDIDENCGLKVLLEDGSSTVLRTGEISVRPAD